MGRVYLGPKDKARAKKAEAFKELFGTIEKYRDMKVMERKEFLILANITQGVWYRRKQMPDMLSFGELIRIIETLRIPYSEIEPMIKAILS